MTQQWRAADWIKRFGVEAQDPGFVYVVKAGSRYKIGRTVAPKDRMRAARTWLPELQIVGIKPFWGYKNTERLMHVGFARAWKTAEWFELPDEGYRMALVDGFAAFDDHDINRNSVDFIYWFNGDGMAEFVMERSKQGTSIPQFLKSERDYQSG